MNVLTYVPLAPRTPRIYARTIASIFKARWPSSMPIIFGREDEPKESKYANIVKKHNEARALCLRGGYDGLMLVENDMILPEDTFEKLCRPDFDVMYGLYVGRHGWQKWLAFFYITDHGGVSFSDDKERALDAWGKVKVTQGVGMGCTFINRHVLEKIEFRYDPHELVADDWLFSLDCIKHGFSQAHDFSVVCGHMKPRGEILWPDITSEGLYTIEYPDTTEIVPVTPDKPYTFEVKGFTTEVIHGSKSNRESTPG